MNMNPVDAWFPRNMTSSLNWQPMVKVFGKETLIQRLAVFKEIKLGIKSV